MKQREKNHPESYIFTDQMRNEFNMLCLINECALHCVRIAIGRYIHMYLDAIMLCSNVTSFGSSALSYSAVQAPFDI